MLVRDRSVEHEAPQGEQDAADDQEGPNHGAASRPALGAGRLASAASTREAYGTSPSFRGALVG